MHILSYDRLKKPISKPTQTGNGALETGSSREPLRTSQHSETGVRDSALQIMFWRTQVCPTSQAVSPENIAQIMSTLFFLFFFYFSVNEL